MDCLDPGCLSAAILQLTPKAVTVTLKERIHGKSQSRVYPRTNALPIRLDRDAAEKLLLPLVITCASQQDLERSHLIGSDRFHMAAVDRDRDRLRR
jgi:hypothetical protein